MYFKEMRFFTLFMMIFIILPSIIFSQDHAQDPAIQKAREETVVITDLGRLFGFLVRMDRDEPKLKISKKQAEELGKIAEEIDRLERFAPSRAKAMLTQIEESILTPAQLLYTDMLFAERDANRVPGSGVPGSGSSGSSSSGRPAGTEPGSGAGGGILTTYLAGGPYNPLRDESRQQGKDFKVFLELARERVKR